MNAKLCHKCNEQHVGRLCPKCTPKKELQKLTQEITEFLQPPSVYCNACTSYHPVPRDKAHHRALKCFAPWFESNATTPSATPKPARSMGAPALNKTEHRWQEMHPHHVAFPMRLRWGNCMHYKADFMERQPSESGPDVTLFEVKGGWIDPRDIVRFKGCAAEWGWLFTFEMWQWKDRAWTRIY